MGVEGVDVDAFISSVPPVIVAPVHEGVEEDEEGPTPVWIVRAGASGMNEQYTMIEGIEEI